MNFQEILEQIEQDVRPLFGQGKVADYIPALAKVPGDSFAMVVRTAEGEEFQVGQATQQFSIQSISKLFTLMQAVELSGDEIWDRVGREPSGNAFNSLIQLEHEKGIPRNPFINAGAIVITDIIASRSADASRRISDFYRKLSGNKTNRIDEVVALSEKAHGHRNAALAHFMKSFGNIDSPVDDLLDIYFRQCSLTTSCLDLARAGTPLMLEGYSDIAGKQILGPRNTKRINSLMMTCGLYDAVGNFAFRVGLPAKSGVGGGILAVYPRKFTVAVWSPELDTYGNSCVGTKALEWFTDHSGISVF
ncbi:glutaminase [Terasakiella sp. A23]|uniref:glutaminase n=1 Tax=Terasakiella sp. FCG-A23 TaxID=3080561 RepID=UPI002952B7BD|nr:glutaminase [Terasakiella sp. A23]MDV7340573.1 glutaminase [Terasakiella sp. A23]